MVATNQQAAVAARQQAAVAACSAAWLEGEGRSACVNAWVGDGDGDEEADGEDDFDGDGLADFVGDADGVGANVDTWRRVGAVAGLRDRELRGLGLADAPLVAAGVTLGAAALWVWAARARTRARRRA